MPVHELTQSDPVIILNAVSAANTAAATSAGVDLSGYIGEFQVVVQTGAITGTLDGAIQDSADNSSFAAIATPITFAQVTAPNKIAKVDVPVNSVRRYIRYIGTVATGPVLISVIGNGFKEYK